LVTVNGKKFVPCEVGNKVLYVSESHVVLQCPEIQGWRQELLNNKWLHINEETTLRKTLAVKNVTEQEKIWYLCVQHFTSMGKLGEKKEN